jgi:hypothetical protein
MKTPSIAIVTPSYPPDFERCRLLVESVQQHVLPKVTQYLIVKKRDVPLFSELKGPRTEIVVAESILPWWMQKIPLLKNGWINFQGAVVRNWILQQIVKLSAARAVQEDVLAFVDSDVAFIRPFDIGSFVRGGQVRLFRVAGGNRLQAPQGKAYDDLDEGTSHALGTPLLHLPDNYEGQMITWRRDNAIRLQDHISAVHGVHWVTALSRTRLFYEYFLYGVFVDRVMKEGAGHFHDDSNICHCFWEDRSMEDGELRDFFGAVQPGQVAVMLSSKAGMPVARYRHLVERLQ